MRSLHTIRTGVLLVVSFLALAVVSTAYANDDEELVDVSKTVTNLEKKMSELRAQGRWARDGRLSLSAICGEQEPSQVFLPWGDTSNYVSAPGGDFESATSWTLNKHSNLADQNSPFSTGASSLFLGDHGEAVSPAMCVGTLYPTFRFFAVNGASAESKLEIEVLYEGLDGKVKKLKVARLRGGDSWSPSLTVPLYVNSLAAASEDGLTAVAFHFKAVGAKSNDSGWMIDDLAVDPFASR